MRSRRIKIAVKRKGTAHVVHHEITVEKGKRVVINWRQIADALQAQLGSLDFYHYVSIKINPVQED